MEEKIVITGMGTINSLAHNVKETWDNLINGVSGVGKITLFDASELRAQIACEVKDYHPEEYLSRRDIRRRDRFEQFASIAALEAISQAGLHDEKVDPKRVGVIISSSIGGLNTLYEAYNAIHQKGPHFVSPFTIPMMMMNGGAGMVSIDHGFQGSSFSVASACTSSADAIGVSWLMLKTGMMDAVVTGGCEATVTRVGIATFDRVGALSHRNDDFETTPRPFDLNRDGLVMGEGSAVIVLERESHARKRGAEILAELAGYGGSSDAFHITAPSEDGSGGSLAIINALNSARVNIDEVDYINAHGTGTILNDVSETRAIKKAFGALAYKIPASSTKSMTGHMMGATGALETIFLINTIRNNIMPPTIHYETPDPECDLDYVPNVSREKQVKVAISNAFGFGGHNGVLVVREYQ